MTAGGCADIGDDYDLDPAGEPVERWYGYPAEAPEALAEEWCQDCDQPATTRLDTTRGARYLCDHQAAMLNWKMTSPACNPSGGRKGATR